MIREQDYMTPDGPAFAKNMTRDDVLLLLDDEESIHPQDTRRQAILDYLDEKIKMEVCKLDEPYSQIDTIVFWNEKAKTGFILYDTITSPDVDYPADSFQDFVEKITTNPSDFIEYKG